MRHAPTRGTRLATALLAALAAAACDQPPAKEIAAAQAALEAARKDEADRYAPDRFKEAQAALEAARSKAGERDYRGALSSATEATERARTASQQAGVVRTMARSAAELAQAEVQAALDEIAGVREAAAKEKVPAVVFEELDPLVEQVKRSLAAVAQALEAGDLLGAQKAASEVKAQAAPLSDRFREAVDTWKAARPKGRGRAAPAKPFRK